MCLFNKVLKYGLLIGSVLFGTAGSIQAQESAKSGNEMHFMMHQDMLADQVNIHKEMALVDSLSVLYRLRNEEIENPALDIYEGWDTENVFRNLAGQIPDSAMIDVSGYFPPAMGRKTSDFGWRRRRMHKGVDLKVQIGDTIRAAFNGKVRIRKFERRGYGYYLVIRHPNGLETVYGHLSKFLVNVEDDVKAGQAIALGGNTGRSTGSHLHFESRLMGVAINPNEIFDFENGVAHTDTYKFVGNRCKAIANGDMGPGGIAYHKVRKGDTLGKIARKYNISVERLCRLNKMKKSKVLRVGQRLRYS